MENDPLLTPPKIWNFPYVSSLFFLKASLSYCTFTHFYILTRNHYLPVVSVKVPFSPSMSQGLNLIKYW